MKICLVVLILLFASMTICIESGASNIKITQAKTLIDKGDRYASSGQNQKALNAYKQALDVSRKVKDAGLEATALYYMGNIYLKDSMHAEALSAFHKLLKIDQVNKDELNEAIDLNNIGYSYFKLRRYPEAIEYLSKALGLTQKVRDAATESLALVNLGDSYVGLYQYEKALNHYLNALNYLLANKDLPGQANINTKIGLIHSRLKDFSTSISYYQQAMRIYTQLEDSAGKAQVLWAIGINYFHLANYQDALKHYQPILKISRETGDSLLESRVLINIGEVYDVQGRHLEALEQFQLAIAISNKNGNLRVKEQALGSVGITNSKLGRYSEALVAYTQALEIGRITKNKSGEAAELQNIGIIYSNRGQHVKALEYQELALDIHRETRNISGEAGALANIGVLYNDIAYYDKALEYQQQALEMFRRVKDPAGEGTALDSIGTIYINLNQYEKALKHYEQSLELSRKIGDISGAGRTLGNLGLVNKKFGQYDKAMKYYEQSLAVNRKIGHSVTESATLNNIGTIYSTLGQHDKALPYFEQSLDIKRRVGDIVSQPGVLLNIGIIAAALKNSSVALKTIQESISLSENIRAAKSLWRGHSALGKYLWASGKATEAVPQYERAIEVIEEIYGHTSGFKEEERSSLIGAKSFVYDEFIKLLLELHRKHPGKRYGRQAFSVSEQSKSRVFQEMLAKAGARAQFSGDEAFLALIEKERQSAVELSNLNQQLSQERSRPGATINLESVQVITQQIVGIEKSLMALVKEIEKKYPRYVDLKRPKPLQVEDLQAVLAADETVLNYSVGKEHLVAFVISKKSFKLIELKLSRDALRQLAKTFREGISSTGDLGFDPMAAHELYRMIFEPVAPALGNRTKLYVSADDILYTLPFEALVDEEVDTEVFLAQREKWEKGEDAMHSEYGTLHYLIDSLTLTYLPSASVLRSLRTYAKSGYGNWETPLVAFADPIFGKEDAEDSDKGLSQRGIVRIAENSLEQPAQSSGRMQLKRLRQTASEAIAISDILDSSKDDIYLRGDASEENVHNARLGRARYILFATHGFLGGEFNGMTEPTLALTLVGNSGDRDGLLTMSEVLGLDLNAELVVLSACNTSGEGEKAGQGEEFAGLTRSFMYAGSKALLVTHWSVESTAAKDLMVGTFELMKLKSKPDALRKAKIKIKSSTRKVAGKMLSQSHPYFWAAYVIVGEGS